MTWKNQGYCIFIIGILFDIFTTAIGQYKGFGELNIIGFRIVYLTNFIVLAVIGIIMDKHKDLETNKYVQFTLLTIGILRFGVGVYNILLIGDYI